MITGSNLSDIELMQKVSEFDSKALELLYNRYSPILFTMVKKISGEEKYCEEILSDVFVIIWRKSNLFDFENGNVYSWIINLTRNKALDFLNRLKESTSLPEYDDSFEDENIIPHSKSELPEIKLVLDRKEFIDKAFKKLTDAQQYVINLAYYEGLTSEDISARLHIPPQTVKAKIKVAVNILRDNLSKGEAV